MKIAFISAHPFTYPGGIKTHILNLKRELEKKGHQIKIILPRDRFPQKKEKDFIFLGGALYIPGNASRTNLSFALNPYSIYKKLKEEKFDILHFQSFNPFLSWQILEISKHFFKNIINIITLHSVLDASWLSKEFSIFEFLNKYILPKFDGVIAVSSPTFYQINYKGLKEIIPNGIDLNFFRPKGELIKKFEDKKKVNLLFVGRFEKRKGLIYLLKAYKILKKKYHNLRLIIIGDGEKRKKIENFINENKLKDVFLEGKAELNQLPGYYRVADICCFPSIYGEAFGIVLLEAMASEKPIVAFRNQGYKEILIDKGKDFLVEPKNFKELAKKIEILIKDKSLREELGRWGRKETEKYSWDKIAKRTLDFYKKVIKQKSN